MARRILSADAALMPAPQFSLNPASRAERADPLLLQLEQRFAESRELNNGALLFDWEDRSGLMREIDLVNQVQDVVDRAAVRIAPSLLRIVLTLRANVEDVAGQRAFLAEHLHLDFRRISELCIAAESYRLLDPEWREEGEAEIERYGWSKALKLAYVRDPAARTMIWENASNGKGQPSYRAVLEEIRAFRQRKVIPLPTAAVPLGECLRVVENRFEAFRGSARQLESREDYAQALDGLSALQRQMTQLRRALQIQMEQSDVESMAAYT